MAMEYTDGKMVVLMKEDSIMILSMGKEQWSMKMEKWHTLYGRTEKFKRNYNYLAEINQEFKIEIMCS